MKRRKRDIEYREYKRVEVPIPLRLKLRGMSIPCPAIHAEAANISLEGLMMELNVTLKDGSLLIRAGDEYIKLIPYLVLNEKRVELEMTIPQEEKKIRAVGRIIWYDFGSIESLYHLQMGIFLEEMESEDRRMWEKYVKKT